MFITVIIRKLNLIKLYKLYKFETRNSQRNDLWAHCPYFLSYSFSCYTSKPSHGPFNRSVEIHLRNLTNAYIPIPVASFLWSRNFTQTNEVMGSNYYVHKNYKIARKLLILYRHMLACISLRILNHLHD